MFLPQTTTCLFEHRTVSIAHVLWKIQLRVYHMPFDWSFALTGTHNSHSGLWFWNFREWSQILHSSFHIKTVPFTCETTLFPHFPSIYNGTIRLPPCFGFVPPSLQLYWIGNVALDCAGGPTSHFESIWSQDYCASWLDCPIKGGCLHHNAPFQPASFWILLLPMLSESPMVQYLDWFNS